LSRARIVSLFIALAALSAVLAACGGGSSNDPQAIVEEATLKGVESGKLDLALDVGVQGKKSGNVKINLSGPFQSEAEAELPELDLSFAANGKLGGEKVDREGSLTLLGNKAFVGYEGTEYEVDSTTFGIVKSTLDEQGGKGKSGEATACREAASKLDLNDFVENLKSAGSADVGGTETTKVSGDLNTPAAVEALSELLKEPTCSEQLSSTGGPLPSTAELEEAESTFKNSVKSAHVDLYVGDDHIVRRIVAKATVEPKGSDKGSAKRVDLDLDMTLTGVNEEQSISAPASSKPLSDLFLRLGINPIELLGQLQGGGGIAGLGGLLEKLNQAGSHERSQEGPAAGGGGGQQSYYECLGEAHSATDIQNCTGLLQ
jgi:uncharacterized protein YidB (DUF937 family)